MGITVTGRVAGSASVAETQLGKMRSKLGEARASARAVPAHRTSSGRIDTYDRIARTATSRDRERSACLPATSSSANAARSAALPLHLTDRRLSLPEGLHPCGRRRACSPTCTATLVPLAVEHERGRRPVTGSSQPSIAREELRSIAIPRAAARRAAADRRGGRGAALGDRRAAGAIERAQRRSPRSARAILERAFRGELVPQDPSDEPAESLLARIRAERDHVRDGD